MPGAKPCRIREPQLQGHVRASQREAWVSAGPWTLQGAPACVSKDVSHGCYNNTPQTWRLKATGFCSLTAWRSEGKAQVWAGAPGDGLLARPGSAGHVTPISASVSTPPSPLLWVSNLPLPPFYHDTVTGFRTNPWMISSQHGHLHPSATALFTNKATFASPRDGMWLSLVEPFSGSHRRAAG